MIDIHCHMLPGIDDGPQSWGESLAIARRASEIGIKTAVVTPHFIPGVYRWRREKGEALHAEFRRRLAENEIPLETHLAAEVGIFAELPEWIVAGKVPLMPTGQHILLETPMYGGENMLRDMAFFVLSLDVIPIFAHPERSVLFQDLHLARDLVETNAELQLDAGGLLGQWGSEIKRLTLNLIDQGFVHYVASDTHGTTRRDPKDLLRAAEIIEEIWGKKIRDTLTYTNPLSLLKKNTHQEGKYKT